MWGKILRVLEILKFLFKIILWKVVDVDKLSILIEVI